MILTQIVKAKRARLEIAKSRCSIDEIQTAAETATVRLCGQNFPFEQALRQEGLQLICEVKKASPSKGVISPDYPYERIALDYEAGGAAAISCLTEQDYFFGDPEHLLVLSDLVKLPLLRKDFVIDEFQIYETVALGAAAILLIVSILDERTLRTFLSLAHSLGLSALVEARDADEIRTAVAAGAKIIGVNNRDLRDFSVDFGNSLRLRAMLPADCLFVAESGVSGRADIELLEAHDVDAALVGEFLMKSPDIRAAISSLRGRVPLSPAEEE